MIEETGGTGANPSPLSALLKKLYWLKEIYLQQTFKEMLLQSSKQEFSLNSVHEV